MVLDNPDTPDFTVQTVDPWLLTINGSRAGVYTIGRCVSSPLETLPADLSADGSQLAVLE